MLLPVIDETVDVLVSAARLNAATKVTGTETKYVKLLVVFELLEDWPGCVRMFLLFIFFFLKQGF